MAIKVGDKIELGKLADGTKFRTSEGAEGIAGANVLEPDEVVEVVELPS